MGKATNKILIIIIMAATGWRAGGGMGYHPYKYPLKAKFAKALGIKSQTVGGGWVHNPLHTYWDAFKGANLATTIAQGNYMTRNFRQKPIVGLIKAEHKRRPPLVGRSAPPKVVNIPTVSQRRVKDFSKNKILAITKAMPYKKSSKSSRKSFKKATNSKNKSNRKKTTKPKTPVKVLAKQVRALQKAVAQVKSTHTYKASGCADLRSLVGRCNHTAIADISLVELEASCANLRYYDQTDPATLITANSSTGTYARDVFIKSLYSKLSLRNNYQVPARIKVYLCKVKNDTNETPLTTYTTAIADQVINAGVDETDILIHLTDIERVREVWKVDCVLDRTLEPGQECSTSNSVSNVNFDPSHIDSYGNAYQQTFKGSCYVIRLEGVLGHDTTADEQTILQAGVDIQIDRKIVIEYDSGGHDLNDIYIYENRLQAFTNGGVCSLKPVADNIAYSVN